MLTVHTRTWLRRSLPLLTVAAVAACSAPATPSPQPTVGPRAVTEPAIVTIRLDVTGTGTGTIRYSSDHGPQQSAVTVLYGWSYTYMASSKRPIILEVRHRADLDASCAVHIDGRLRTADSGINPVCTVNQT